MVFLLFTDFFCIYKWFSYAAALGSIHWDAVDAHVTFAMKSLISEHSLMTSYTQGD